METNNIKASRIKAVGNNLSNIGYTMILVIVISLVQFFVNKEISEQSQSHNIEVALHSAKKLETSNYFFTVLYYLCSITIIVNFISAGKNLSYCEEPEADVIPNVDSEKLLLKLNMTKSNSGKIANGGIIVYTDEKGEHGLVCSNNDLGNGNWNVAKEQCEVYNKGGFLNWRLPTKVELQLIYLLLHKRKIGGFANNDYWSSAEGSNNNAWKQSFLYGRHYTSYKSTKCNIRAVRAF